MGEPRDQPDRKTGAVKANPSSTSPGKENCVLHKQISMPYNSRQQFVLVSVYESDQVGDSFVGQATLPLADQQRLQSTAPWPLIKDGIQNGVVTLNVTIPTGSGGSSSPSKQLCDGGTQTSFAQLSAGPYQAPPATGPMIPQPAQNPFHQAPNGHGAAPPLIPSPEKQPSIPGPTPAAPEPPAPTTAPVAATAPATAIPGAMPAVGMPMGAQPNLFQGFGLQLGGMPLSTPWAQQPTTAQLGLAPSRTPGVLGATTSYAPAATAGTSYTSTASTGMQLGNQPPAFGVQQQYGGAQQQYGSQNYSTQVQGYGQQQQQQYRAPQQNYYAYR